MSTESAVAADVDLAENSATVTIEVTVSEVFNDAGELRLWEDSVGWNGYLRDTEDGEAVYYHDQDDWLRRVRVGERAVRDAVRDHIEDPQAGGVGTFVRRCSPP